MKAQLTSAAAEIRGKVAGTVIRNVEGSTILTTKVKAPVYKHGDKLNRKQKYAYWSARWRTLPESIREQWQRFDLNGTKGFHAFIAIQVDRLSFGVIPITPPPTPPNFLELTSFQLANNPFATLLQFKFTYRGSRANQFVHFYVSRPLPATRNQTNTYTYYKTSTFIPPSPATLDIFSYAFAPFGPVAHGMKQFVKIQFVQPNLGYKMQPLFLSIIRP